MKLEHLFLLTTMVALLAAPSCKDDDGRATEPSFLTCQLANGEDFAADETTWFPLQGKVQVFGSNEAAQRSMKLLLPLDVQEGTYLVGPSDSVGGVFQFSAGLLMFADSGSIEVNNFDEGKRLLEGKFHLRVKSDMVSGIVLQTELTEGKFRARQ